MIIFSCMMYKERRKEEYKTFYVLFEMEEKLIIVPDVKFNYSIALIFPKFHNQENSTFYISRIIRYKS